MLLSHADEGLLAGGVEHPFLNGALESGTRVDKDCRQVEENN